MLNRAEYLERIQYAHPINQDFATLNALHRAHLEHVPFENLDIPLGRPIQLNLPDLFTKIVLHRRGGFCYELNGLFAWLLQDLGFEVTYLSASDASADGTYGPEFDHLALVVRIPGDPSQEWLADVGWGDTFRTPLRLHEQSEQIEGARIYRIEQVGDNRLLWQRDEQHTWERQYRFTLQPRNYSDFAAMCLYHQTSEASPFVKKRICTLATADGRITLSNSRFITTINGQRNEEEVDNERYQTLLRERFGIVLGAF